MVRNKRHTIQKQHTLTLPRRGTNTKYLLLNLCYCQQYIIISSFNLTLCIHVYNYTKETDLVIHNLAE